MGHAHHFLSRLDRVSFAHAELALSLYNDPDCLAFILQSVRIPEGMERVAISMEDPDKGPFLVVTRNGRFVTCLSEGMTPKGLHVISRGQLDALGTRFEKHRGRIAQYRKMAAEKIGVRKLISRLHESADFLSREEFMAIAAWQPMMAEKFLMLLLEASKVADELRRLLLRQIRRTDKLDRRYEEDLFEYWKTAWAMGHICLLSALEGAMGFTSVSERMQEALAQVPITMFPFHGGFIGAATRALWAAARFGKFLLPAYKRYLYESHTFYSIIHAALSLFAIGVRHSRVRAEVRKTLASGPKLDDKCVFDADLLRIFSQDVGDVLDMYGREPETFSRDQREGGVQKALAIAKGLRPDSPYKFTSAADVPESIAMCLPVNSGQSYKDVLVLDTLTGSIPWVATVEAEDLYLPADYIAAIRRPWTPDAAMALLLDFRGDPGAREDFRRQSEGPTRNGPCPCGSGKKYKRCCADKEE